MERNAQSIVAHVVYRGLFRAKKLNGVQRFKFSGVPVIREGNTEGQALPATDCFYLEEQEPLRLIQDKLPIRLMQYDTTFGATKKQLLRCAHVTLDRRRKYHILCAIEYWPIFEIWQMNGNVIYMFNQFFLGGF